MWTIGLFGPGGKIARQIANATRQDVDFRRNQTPRSLGEEELREERKRETCSRAFKRTLKDIRIERGGRKPLLKQLTDSDDN